jgi:hypothetical protein
MGTSLLKMSRMWLMVRSRSAFNSAGVGIVGPFLVRGSWGPRRYSLAADTLRNERSLITSISPGTPHPSPHFALAGDEQSDVSLYAGSMAADSRIVDRSRPTRRLRYWQIQAYAVRLRGVGGLGSGGLTREVQISALGFTFTPCPRPGAGCNMPEGWGSLSRTRIWGGACFLKTG